MILKNMCVQTKETVKQFCKENPKALMRSAVCAVAAMIISGSSFICFADSGESSINHFVTPDTNPDPEHYYHLSAVLMDYLDSLFDRFCDFAIVVVPIGLVIFGTVFGIHYGMKLFKKASH